MMLGGKFEQSFTLSWIFFRPKVTKMENIGQNSPDERSIEQFKGFLEKKFLEDYI